MQISFQRHGCSWSLVHSGFSKCCKSFLRPSGPGCAGKPIVLSLAGQAGWTRWTASRAWCAPTTAGRLTPRAMCAMCPPPRTRYCLRASVARIAFVPACICSRRAAGVVQQVQTCSSVCQGAQPDPASVAMAHRVTGRSCRWCLRTMWWRRAASCGCSTAANTCPWTCGRQSPLCPSWRIPSKDLGFLSCCTCP